MLTQDEESPLVIEITKGPGQTALYGAAVTQDQNNTSQPGDPLDQLVGLWRSLGLHGVDLSWCCWLIGGFREMVERFARRELDRWRGYAVGTRSCGFPTLATTSSWSFW